MCVCARARDNMNLLNYIQLACARVRDTLTIVTDTSELASTRTRVRDHT
jgi:hypothetical protein